jgi:hypothetical protein
VSYTNPEGYSHDHWGLTDRKVARDDPHYRATFGKYHPLYTFHDIRPTIYVTHAGTGYAAWIEHLSGRDYNRRYRTYQLRGLLRNATVSKTRDCEGNSPYIISIRKSAAERIPTALEELKPRRARVTVGPTFW